MIRGVPYEQKRRFNRLMSKSPFAGSAWSAHVSANRRTLRTRKVYFRSRRLRFDSSNWACGIVPVVCGLNKRKHVFNGMYSFGLAVVATVAGGRCCAMFSQRALGRFARNSVTSRPSRNEKIKKKVIIIIIKLMKK